MFISRNANTAKWRNSKRLTDEEVWIICHHLKSKSSNREVLCSLKRIALGNLTLKQLETSKIGTVVNDLMERALDIEVKRGCANALSSLRSLAAELVKAPGKVLWRDIYDKDASRAASRYPVGEEKRNLSVKLITSMLVKSPKIEPGRAAFLAKKIEKEIHLHSGDCESVDYSERLFYICKACSDTEFANEIDAGRITAASMLRRPPEEINPMESQLNAMELGKKLERAHSEAKEAKEAPGGSVKCPKCKGTNTRWVQVQDRCGDESMTVNCQCNKCNHKWKLN